MKKRLLMIALMAVVCTVGVFAAYNAGDYIYSATAKYQIQGANLVTNGAFNVGDGTEGWTSETGTAIDGSIWGVVTGAGPNGENVLASLAAGAEEGQTLMRVWPISAGFYTISYAVKAPSAVSSSVTVGANNYVNFFLNETGDQTITTAVAQAAAFSTEWTEVVMTVQVASDGYLVFNANNVATDIQFTNFEIHQAVEVYDTRVAERFIAEKKKILSEPAFDGAGDYILDYLSQIEEAISGTEVDGDDVTSKMEELEVEYQNFLNTAAGNLIGTTDADGVRTTRYLTDWATRGYSNWNNLSSFGTWTLEGGRWGFSPNDESLERPANDGYVATAGIQTGYDLNVGTRISSGAFNNTSIKAGKYLFSIEAQAVAAGAKSAPYGSDNSVIISDPYIWLANDTTTLEGVILNGYYWQKFYKILEITEEDINNGVEVSAGFHFPLVASKGGRYSLRNPEFRLIGKSQDEIDHLYAYDQLEVQQTALKARLDSAAMINAYTQADGYPWGHAVLNDSITKFTELYNELLTVVDANGNELQPDKVTLEFKDEILTAVRNMNSAISNFHNANKKHYQVLKDDIAVCNEALNAEKNAAGDKATFKAVIDKAQAMVDGTTVDGDQMDEFDAMDEEMLIAKETFEKGTASRANPTSLYLPGKNLNFESWTSKSTYSSDQTVNGWNITIGADGKQWDIQPSDKYELGGRASIWRGTSVGPNGKMQQTVTLTTPGVYEFRSRAFSAEYGDGAKWAEYMAIAKICGSIFDEAEYTDSPVDTIYHPNVRLFFGPEGATRDSITLTKCAPADYISGSNGLIWTRETGMEYSVIYVKTTSEEEKVEFGLEAFQNGATAGASTFGFGDNRLYYLGPEAAYTAATDADYNAEVAKAKSLIDQYATVEDDGSLTMKTDVNVGWIIYKLMRYVGHEKYPWNTDGGFSYQAPATLQEKQNVYLSLLEYEKMLAYTVDPALGINEVATSEPQAAAATAAGVYTLSGVKVAADVKNLKPGLYIIGGKKYLVK